MTTDSSRNLLCVLFLALSSLSYAGSASCSSATALIPDGRVLDFDNVQPSTTVWYTFTAAASRSYSVEVRDDVDPDNTDLSVTMYGPNGVCGNLTQYTATTDTHSQEPIEPTSATRFSFVTSSSQGGHYWLKVVNGSNTTSHYISASVTETTLYSPVWTTSSSYTTYYWISNTTSQAVSFTITLTASYGNSGGPYSATGSVGPNSAVQLYTGTAAPAIIIPANQAGTTLFTHNGAPGSIQIDAAWMNFSSYPGSIRSAPIGPIRGK